MAEKHKSEKKKVVIHTRVSEPLEQALKEKASDLGLSVSTLVRNLLNNTVDMVEEVVVDSARVAGSARGVPPQERVDWRKASAEAPGPAMSGKRLGWQKFRLSMNALCSQCNGILPLGSRAYVSVDTVPSPREVACTDCVDVLCTPSPRAES